MTKSFHYPQVDLNNVTAIAVWYETHDIPQRYNAAIVFASVLVACLGAHSTLVILGKRTGNDGIKNTMLLIWSAMTMSCVGIWGMHFIGMNFRLEPVPGMNWYVAFSPGFTVFSLIVPFISLVLAFVFVDYYTLRIWRIVVSGILTGCIVGLMHYSASMKSNFNVSYAPAQTIISILLACFCAIIALTLFFRLRAQWQDSWQRRLFCSIILAIGVSGMHYTGSSGTSYRIKSSQIENLERLKNDGHGNLTVVIIVAVMCFVIFVVSTFISVSDVITARETRKRARKIVLASASFDHLGRLLVQADGSLPFVTLEEKTLRHSEVLDALDSRSEIFQWLFSISWAWNIVIPFLNVISDRVGKTQKSTSSSISLEHAACEEGVPCNHPWYIRLARRLHIDIASRKARQEEKKAQMASIAANATSFNAGIAHNTRSIALLDFRDRVVDAARRLSDQLELSLEEVGVFYDHILSTGTKKHLGPKATLARHQRQLFGMREKRGLGTTLSHSNDDDDEEASISTSRVPSIFAEDDDNDDELEEGVSMFLVREVSAAQQMIFAKRGYRFTETRFLTNVLADRHGVGKMRMDELLDGLKLYAKRGTRPVVQPGGVYAGLFGVRPSMTARQGGLDVLVYNFARHQIPAFRLPDVVTMTNEMRTFLRLLDQMPVDQALKICERESIRTAERNKAIARLLLDQAQQQKLQQSEVFSLRRSSEALSAAISQSDSLGGTTVLGDLTKDSNWSNEENLRQVLDLQTQEASLQAFQIALYTALEALMQSVRVFPRLMSTARLSADVLEVPSSLDDAKPPAYVILVQAVLPIDKATNARSSASMLSGLVGQNNGIGESSNSSNNAFKPTLGSLVMPTETPQNGTPFVFTPYTLFTKTQTMLLRGKTAQKFTLEVQQALGDRYNVDLLDSTMFVEENEKDKKFSEDEIEVAYLSRNKSLSIKNDNEGIADGDEKENAENGQDSSKGWMGRLLNGGKNSNIASRKQSLVDDIPNDKIIIIEDNSSIHQSEKPTRLPLSPVAGGLVTSSTLNDLNDLQNNQIGSLGIRRFTGTGTNGEIQNNEIDQSKFARPAEDIELQQTSSSTLPLKRPSYPPSAARYYKRQGSMNSLVREESIRSRISRQSSDSFGNGNGNDESQITSTSMIKSNSMQQSNSNRSRGRSHTIGVTGNRPIGLSNPEITVSDSRQAIQEINGNTLISKISFVNALGIPKRPQTAHSIGGGIGRPRSASHTGRQSSESAHEVQNHLRVHKNNISNSANQRGSPHTLNDLDYTPINVDHDSIQARQRLDNWQLRQLRDLERFQPNLLMGVLPSEY